LRRNTQGKADILMTFQSGKSGNPKGMKPIKLTRVQLAQITKDAAGGSPEIVIAHELKLGFDAECKQIVGMNEATWHRMKQRDPRIGEALALGKAQQERFYHRNLMRMAPNNVVANIFPLKAKHGWVDQPQPDTQPHVTIVLPGPARSIEDFRPPQLTALVKVPDDEKK